MPCVFLGTGDVAVNKTDDFLALINLYPKGRVNRGGKKQIPKLKSDK